MSLSTNTTYRVYVEKLGATSVSQFVGNPGEIFYDPADPKLKFSDGSTAGGLTLGGSGIIGHLYMTGNSTDTTFPAASSNVWTKVLGTTTVGDYNVGFTHTNNRLTCTSTTNDRYLVTSAIYFEGDGGTFTSSFGFYDSNVSGIRTSSTVTHEAENLIINHVNLSDVVQLNQNDYIEVHAKNVDDDTAIKIVDMNLIITKI